MSQQLQIKCAIERLPSALRLPQRLAEAFENFVFCCVFVVVLGGELRVDFGLLDADAEFAGTFV